MLWKLFLSKLLPTLNDCNTRKIIILKCEGCDFGVSMWGLLFEQNKSLSLKFFCGGKKIEMYFNCKHFYNLVTTTNTQAEMISTSSSCSTHTFWYFS